MGAMQNFSRTVVHPNADEALKRPNDRRAVFNACAAIEALASQIYWHAVDHRILPDLGDGKYKATLAEMNEAFSIIHDVAESQKHGRLTRGSSKHRKVKFADDVRSEPQGWGYTRWDEFMFDVDQALAVQVDGEMRLVASLAVRALTFIEGEVWLAENGDSSALAWPHSPFKT